MFVFRRQCRTLAGSRRSLVAEEVRRVQTRHRKVLGELNLSVEAMLMPPANEDDHGISDERRGASTEELLSSVSPTDDLLSPVACDLDSGFSGSSSASYRYTLSKQSRSIKLITPPSKRVSMFFFIFRHFFAVSNTDDGHVDRSGLGSLRRGCDANTSGEYANNRHQRKPTKAVMLWKKGLKGWKKLQTLGSNAHKIGEYDFLMIPNSINEPARRALSLSRNDARLNLISTRD